MAEDVMPATEKSVRREPRSGEAVASPEASDGKGTNRGKALKAKLMDWGERYATLVGFALMVLVFWMVNPSTFGSIDNLKAILDQAAVPVLLGVGLTAVLAVAEFDLSFPYVLGLSSAVATLAMTDHQADAVVTVVAGVVVAIVASAVGGYFVAQQRVSSFIITLGLGFVWTGIADGLTHNQVITTGLNEGFIDMTSNRLFGVTVATWVAAGVAVLIAVIFRWTVLGRYMQSVGSNPQASRLAGLPVARLRIIAYGILGLSVGIAAMIITSRQAQYTPGIGNGLFLSPYVAAFFGMSVLAARRFNVFGTVIGALFMGTLQTGLVIIGAEAWVNEVIQGVVLLVILLIARRES